MTWISFSPQIIKTYRLKLHGQRDVIPYPRECNPGVLLIFWVFRPRTVVYFGEKSAKITVFLADFSPKMTKVRPKYVAWGCIQDGVVFTRIRYLLLLWQLFLTISKFFSVIFTDCYFCWLFQQSRKSYLQNFCVATTE